MDGVEGKVIASTGASSGIGEATARLLARQGARLSSAPGSAVDVSEIIVGPTASPY